MNLINADEIIQCGDHFLIKFKCQKCFNINLSGYPIKTCSFCFTDMSEYVVDISSAQRRLLAGVKRKQIRVNKKLMRILISEFGLICTYCSKDLSSCSFEIDHVFPVSLGGTNDMSNLAISCVPCNRKAGRKIFKDINHKRTYLLDVL